LSEQQGHSAAPWSGQPSWPAVAPPPARPGRSPFATRYLVAIVAGLVAVAVAVVLVVQQRATHPGLRPGDCVSLTSSAVQLVGCGSAHDGQVSAVLHTPYETCPTGSDEYDLADNSANLCIDRLLSSH
jgi:hypothetical protein